MIDKVEPPSAAAITANINAEDGLGAEQIRMFFVT
jgi:hypothetical protein